MPFANSNLSRKYRSLQSLLGNKKVKRSINLKEIKGNEEERRIVHMTRLSKQGAQTIWEVPENCLTHNDIMKSSEDRTKFLIKVVYDLFPKQAKKSKWFG